MTDRPFLATIEHRLGAGSMVVTVTIGYGDSDFRGSAEGAADPGSLARLVGEATLRAVELLDGGARHLDLSAVGSTDLGPARVALAQVREAGWSDYLVGSALVRDGDVATATAKAVLDALNRRLVPPQLLP